jgi:hypothetical protein
MYWQLYRVSTRFGARQELIIPMRTAMLTTKRRTEMFRKLTTIVPMAILLGAASAAPAAAQAGRAHLPNQARANSAYALATSATPSSAGCPIMEGYPDCHPNGRAPWTVYPTR